MPNWVENPRERPRYSIGQAACYVRISPTTLRSWVVGRTYPVSGGSAYFEPLIVTPDESRRLSFSNLVEAHVLRSLRTVHEIPMPEVRNALDYAESALSIRRLLLSDELRTTAGMMIIERLGQLLDIGRSGQIVMRELLKGHLQRIDRESGVPFRLFPVLSARGLDGPKIVSIDPSISFGKPFILGKGVRTVTIAERLDAGEDRDEVAADYDLKTAEIDEALLYERAA